MSVTHDDVLKIARLAELEVSEDALPLLAEQMSRILEYVRQIDSVPASEGLRPFVPGPDAVRFRPDEVTPWPLALGLETQRGRPGLRFVRAEAHGVRSGYEGSESLARGHAVDLADVLENPRHLLGQERQRVLAHLELREPRDLQDVVVCNAHALSHSRSSPA